MASLDSLVPAGQKKAPKVYAVACHPLLPHLIAVGANTGAFAQHISPGGLLFAWQSIRAVQTNPEDTGMS